MISTIPEDVTTNAATGCLTVPQVININLPLSPSKLSSIYLYDDKGAQYDETCLEYAYSLDTVTWSCYMSWEEFLSGINAVGQDLYVRIKIKGLVSGIKINGEDVVDYNTTQESCFEFLYAKSTPANFNPYSNLDGAVALQNKLVNMVGDLFGIPVYYFKLSPNAGSKDLTFKEYALMDVESVKMIKLIVPEGRMPSSKPEFADFGMDFQLDWETEVTKEAFATAFGDTAQPMEGDLIYIPLTKRMWMVNGAYEEKSEGLMWIGTTFKLALVKYQEKDSVNMKDEFSVMVDSFVTKKYEDLFTEYDDTVDSGTQTLSAPLPAPNTLTPVYESDAIRKYVDTVTTHINTGENLYYKGTLIADSQYNFVRSSNYIQDPNVDMSKIFGCPSTIYQRKFCGQAFTISFIVSITDDLYSGTLFSIGDFKFNINKGTLKVNKMKGTGLKLGTGDTWFVVFRCCPDLKTVEFSSYKYTFDKRLPIYKLAPVHYFFDMGNADGDNSAIHEQYTMDIPILQKSEMILYSFPGNITNIKVYDYYVDGNLSEVLQMFPNNQHLILNDVARKILDGTGV